MQISILFFVLLQVENLDVILLNGYIIKDFLLK